MAVFSEGIFPPSEFWDFATRLYARGDVEAVCLRLQDRHQANVNVLLFCCWVASSGRGSFRDGELEAALAVTAEWHGNVSMALRTLRRYLRGEVGAAPRRLADDLGRVVAESEIYAEHVEQLMLQDSLQRPGTGTFDPGEQVRAASLNLFAYLQHLKVTLDDQDRAGLAELLGQGFPEAADWLVEQLSKS